MEKQSFEHEGEGAYRPPATGDLRGLLDMSPEERKLSQLPIQLPVDWEERLKGLNERIQELHEELDTVESALRMKDPLTRGFKPRGEPRLLPEKGEMTYGESKKVYEARTDILEELERLENKRYGIEQWLHTPEELESLEETRRSIRTSSKEEDIKAGGHELISEPNPVVHYGSRTFQKYHLMLGYWHAMQGLKWISKKTGLRKLFKGLGKSLDRKLGELKAWNERYELGHGLKREAPPQLEAENKPERRRN